MFGHVRNEDAQLFGQLRGITRDIAQSCTLLERLLSGQRGAAAGTAFARERLAERRLRPRDDVDVRVFTGFAMRLDAAEFRELALALDAAAEAVHEAIAHVESLDGSNAPVGVRALAHSLSLAAVAIQRAVPLAGEGSDHVRRGGSDVQQIADAGETIYFDGVAELFAGTPDVMHVLRWKGIYEKLRHGLESCARSANVLDRLARANA